MPARSHDPHAALENQMIQWCNVRPLCAGLVIATLACGAESTAPAGTVAGAYALVTADGKSLPFTTFNDPALKVELISPSTLTLGTDLSYGFSLSTRVTDDGKVSTRVDSTAGKYVESGGGVTLTSAAGDTRSGSWDGKRTLTFGGVPTLVFQK